MTKYFTKQTYSPHELNELKKLKNKLGMRLHPDHGGTSVEFIDMMNEFKVIEDTLLSNIPFVNETIRVEVNLNNDFNFSGNDSVKTNKETYKASESDLKTEKDYVNIINTFVSDKYINVTNNSIEFNKKVFIAILSAILLLSTVVPLVLILSIILSLFSKNTKLITVNAIALLITLSIFQSDTAINFLTSITSGAYANQMLGIAVMSVIAAPVLILTKTYTFELK